MTPHTVIRPVPPSSPARANGARAPMRAGIVLIAAGVGMWLASPVHAQDVVRLTVDEAVTRGLAHAPRLAEARARAQAADATAAARGAQRRPVAALQSSFVRTNHVEEFGIPQANGDLRVIFPDIPNNYRLRGELTVPVYTGGRVDALVASANADAQAARADGRVLAADVELDIVTAYWAVSTSRARVAVLERAQQRADAVLADVGARVDTGLLPPNERLSAQAQRARQHVSLIQARNEASAFEAQLARLVGLPAGQPIELATAAGTAAPGAAALATRTRQELTTAATAARGEREALAARQTALRAQGTAAVAGLRPQVAAIAAVEPARPNSRFVPRVDEWNTSWDLGVNVTWSLWDGGRARAERAAALAQADAIGARIEDFDAGVGVEVYQRLLDVESAGAALAASADAVTAATEARRVVGERFDVGVATSTELLDADVDLLEAELEQARLRAVLRVSEARLARAVGEP